MADLSRSNSDFKAWGEMLDISVHGFYDYVNRIGEETLFTSVVADPSAKPGHYEVFWGICDVIGGHDVLWTLTTDRAPRMLDVYRRYWRYIPSVPAIAVENMAPYLAFSRYIMGFLSEIYGLSAAVKNKEPITSIPTFHHMSDIVRYLYAAKRVRSILKILTITWIFVTDWIFFKLILSRNLCKGAIFLPSCQIYFLVY